MITHVQADIKEHTNVHFNPRTEFIHIGNISFMITWENEQHKPEVMEELSNKFQDLATELLKASEWERSKQCAEQDRLDTDVA